MVQGVRKIKPTVAWAGVDTRRCIESVRHFATTDPEYRAQRWPDWTVCDVTSTKTRLSQVLCVTEMDLQRAEQQDLTIAWRDVNIIVIETYWQLAWYRDLIDARHQYVVIADTWMCDKVFETNFAWLPTIARFYFKYDSYEILRYLTELDPAWHVSTRSLRSKPWSTFALLGRKDLYRDRFVFRAAAETPHHSLIKYRGRAMFNSAEDLDPRPYNRLNFFEPLGDKYRTGSFDIPVDLYHEFRFETVVETTMWHDGGWPFVEYNISEKTLKPVMAGVPALILAPQGYHAWLSRQLGIDVTCGLFAHEVDNEPDDMVRQDRLIQQMCALARELDQEPDPGVIRRNRAAIIEIMDWNVREIRRCVDVLRDLF